MGLEDPEVYDTEKDVETAVEAVRVLIRKGGTGENIFNCDRQFWCGMQSGCR